MGLGYNGIAQNEWDWDILVVIHEWDWNTIDPGQNGPEPGTQRECTQGMGHSGTGTQWDGGTMGLCIMNGTNTL